MNIINLIDGARKRREVSEMSLLNFEKEAQLRNKRQTTECNVRADVVFLLDIDNGAIWPDVLEFVAEFIEASNSDINVGLISGRELFSLDTYNNQRDILDAVRSASYQGTGVLFQDIADLVDQFQSTDTRPDVGNVAVIITDHYNGNMDQSIDAADVANREGIATFAIGIGGSVNRDEIR